ncbi:hypothetical protein [Paenibacillus xanthanilyticus]|uniref:Yip1 domain-containing protein n=1 Tax=Paenibacillus xanthanilyticus TaxID=1783531 RepID=A0ABV8JZ94_9BACL
MAESAQLHLLSIFLVFLIGGGLVGLISLYLVAWIIAYTGDRLGGQGTSWEIRVALARGGYAPLLVSVLLWPQWLFSQETIVFKAFTLLSFVLGIWLLVLAFVAVSEVQQLGFWKTLLNFVLMLLVLSGFLLIFGIIVTGLLS